MSKRIEPWMQTASGVAFDLLEPRVEDVQRPDIIHHLARINRYSGATIGQYGFSVLQHSLLVSELLEVWGASVAIQWEGMWHDAGEAYYGDLTSPLVAALEAYGGAEAFRELRRRIDPVVRRALGLDEVEHPLVKRADLVALAIERRFLMVGCDRDWKLPEFADTRWTKLVALEPGVVEHCFRERVNRLELALRAQVEELGGGEAHRVA